MNVIFMSRIIFIRNERQSSRTVTTPEIVTVHFVSDLSHLAVYCYCCCNCQTADAQNYMVIYDAGCDRKKCEKYFMYFDAVSISIHC